MPTIIALDVSLSMNRNVTIPDCTEDYQRRHLAINGINTLLDYMGNNCKLEFTSLVVFSYLWEQLVRFTRDYDSIKSALNKIDEYSKTCIETMLAGVGAMVVEEWSTVTPCQLIIVTDGSPGLGKGSLKDCLQRYPRPAGEKFPLPFPFACKIHVVCLANPTDGDLKSSLPLYQKLIDINGGGGQVYAPDAPLTMKSSQQMFTNLAEDYYAPYFGTLRCGNLKCSIQLCPPPEAHNVRVPSDDGEGEVQKRSVSSTLEVCGFLDIPDAASPGTLSRHLVLPILGKDKSKTDDSGESDKVKKEEEEEEGTDDGKTASFTVLLHGSLKVESMVAITKVGEDWYGILYSYADSKKKSNLMLSIFEPGTQSISWLGDFNNLASMTDFSETPYGEDDNKSPFPIRPTDKRSYAQSCVVWIKATGLQADLQKVLRHARKLPDKQQQFYKELNRLRKAALAFGFTDLLDAMGIMLEKECTMLPGSAHPDAALQLSHAANSLQSEVATDISHVILPLRTNFSQDD